MEINEPRRDNKNSYILFFYVSVYFFFFLEEKKTHTHTTTIKGRQRQWFFNLCEAYILPESRKICAVCNKDMFSNYKINEQKK